MVRKALAVLAVAVAIVGIAGLLHSAPVEATSHGAVRSFSASSVLPGGQLEVVMILTGYGGLGQVVETLPAGFAYAGSDLSESQVAVVGQTVTFTLLGEETFTYAVTAPAAEGSYVFSGIIKDVNKVEASVVGASSIRVGPPPTPTPAPTPTPTPTPALTRAPTSTPWPLPAATATLAPTPTPTPTPTLAPTPTPHTHARADPHTHAHARADPHPHPHPHARARADANRHLGARTDGRPCDGRAPGASSTGVERRRCAGMVDRPGGCRGSPRGRRRRGVWP